jgi:hypothetical protein
MVDKQRRQQRQQALMMLMTLMQSLTATLLWVCSTTCGC